MPFTYIFFKTNSNFSSFEQNIGTKNAWALFLTNNWDRIQREKLYKCSACAASFAKKAHLNVHIANVCDANFSLRFFFKNHFTSVYNMEKNWIATFVRLAFHQRQSLIDIAPVHEREKPFKCRGIIMAIFLGCTGPFGRGSFIILRIFFVTRVVNATEC